VNISKQLIEMAELLERQLNRPVDVQEVGKTLEQVAAQLREIAFLLG
jgi:hypothetical protein